MVDDDRLPLQDGETPQQRLVRFRTLGCYPLTGAIESAATTPAEILAELRDTRRSERQGRLIDSDEDAAMERKKREGYF
jgi:sulfate adenylyltransferase subunit 2